MKKKTLPLILTALLLLAPLSAFAQYKRMPAHNVAARQYLEELKAFYESRSGAENNMPGSGYKPYNRALWYLSTRLQPDGTFPVGARWNAFLDLREARNNGSLKALAANWTSIGPTNIAGRMLDIAFDPNNANIIWAGSASGGLWKTTDGGSSWAPADDELPTLAIGCVVTHNTNSNIIYIGTGEGSFNVDAVYGVGVLKSTDGGATWSQTGLVWQLSQNQAVNEMVMDHTNPNVLVAATRDGIYRTVDAGVTWSQRLSVTGTRDTKEIVMDPSNSNILYAAVSHAFGGNANNGIYKSTDNGVTWARLTNGIPTGTTMGRTSLAISASSPSILYAGVASPTTYGLLGVYKTTDGGSTWSLVATTPNFYGYPGGPSQGWYNNVIAVDPSNSNIVYSGGVNLYKSTDGGSIWTDITNGIHVDQHAIAFNAGALYAGNDGGIYKSTNGGASWTSLNNGLLTFQFYKMGSDFTSSTDVMGGSQDNGTIRRNFSPPNSTWFEARGGDGGEVTFDYSNPSIIYGEFQWGNHYKSIDDGASWFPINTGLPSSGSNEFGPWVTPVEMDPVDPNVLYTLAGSTRGSYDLYKTTNGGTSWSLLFNAVESFSTDIKVAPSDNQTIYVSGTSVIYRSTNGGTNWTNVTSGLPTLNISAIAVHPQQSQTLYVAIGGWIAGSHVFKSTNGGSTWQNVTNNLPNVPCNTIVIDPAIPQNVYVGTDLGVYLSTDGGTIWNDWNTGLPNVEVDELDIQRTSRLIRAATHGRGMYEAVMEGAINAPSNLAAALQNHTTERNFLSVRLTWQDNSDNEQNFRIERKTGAAGSWGEIYQTSLTSFLDVALSLGQTYFYRVRANSGSVFSDYSNEANVTVPPALFVSSASLERVANGATAWGDYDNDGDLDVLLTGVRTFSTVSKIYRNSAGQFEDINAGLAGFANGTAEWGDYDHDGDLDLLIGTKIYRNDNGSFVELAAQLPAGNVSTWGDYDNDGDLDILLIGTAASSPITRIYRNDHGTFVDIAAGLAGVSGGTAAWGDYDADGDMDILLAGGAGGNPTAKIYRNDEGIFVDVQAALQGVVSGNGAWGDYDMDGDLDILLIGSTGANRTSKIYRNDSGRFVDIGAALEGFLYGKALWGDYDNNGDLDVFLTGVIETFETGVRGATRIYRNDAGNFVDTFMPLLSAAVSSLAAGDFDADRDLDLVLTGDAGAPGFIGIVYRNTITAVNTAPQAPADLAAQVSGNTATLSWGKSTDAQTPANGLTYNLRLGKTPGGSEIMAPMADAATGLRRIAQLGNTNHRNSWTVKNLAPGTYYWSVQAIDNAFIGSAFAAEQTFTITIKASVTFDFPISGGAWYLISLPVIPPDSSVSALFGNGVSAVGWNNNHNVYDNANKLNPQIGYWLAVNQAHSAIISGMPVPNFTAHFSPGWHLIGGLANAIDFTNPQDTPDGSIIATFGWDPASGSYYPTTTLEPGKGYWIAVAQECDVTIGGGSATTVAKTTSAMSWQEFAASFGELPPSPPSSVISDQLTVNKPVDYGLSQNYPNPFNPETVIEYQLPEAGRVSLKIYDLVGREVRTLINEEKPAGYHRVRWDGKDNAGQKLNSGVYFYRLQVGTLSNGLEQDFVQTRKVVLLK
jgi:photosystem II stability/assembly factor-like uncharacterized protein